MIKNFAIAIALTAGAAAAIAAVNSTAPAAPNTPGTAYDFTMQTIDGKPMPFAQYKGKVLLVVNTASFCGFTPQYEGLQKLQDSYKAKGFTVIGVPSNDFEQESASNAEIKTFCESKFGIKFPLTEKSVVRGADAVPFYRWAATTLGGDKTPKWNFHKYLVGRDGKLIAAFGSKSAPMSTEVTTAVTAALAAKG
ncbi:glutathione peroxidase [Polymorphobacter glacialis]|uniref:Glutathione peroxidase n=1 Tax=Sandarakinorhabdus glacialis TaxID=1614636 RepID=A0A917ED97_9SPHN|nr:glutathione peroxidase [Polymorphobacter glacialis]GGE21109.1 glutathione peroxidase [Polymorphobacter glacialis]